MKKVVISIVSLVVIALAVVGVLLGQRYYNDRYVSSDYYTVVPADYDTTPKMQHDYTGKDIALGVEYKLTAYNTEGESKVVEFTVMDKNSKEATAGEYYQPGTYLLVKASKQIVTGQETIDRGKIPEGVLKLLEVNKQLVSR
ncbi:MAG: YxeA family protein [Candidatus Nomurabacteria bacterium]|jgi:uncharacterized protein (TIGR01655 family)|nr:YxeA family protein [Candidatus Nomurabacteria bacterium]